MYQNIKTKLALIALLTVAVSCSKEKGENTAEANRGGIKLALTENQFGGDDDISAAKASTKAGTTQALSITKEVQSGPFTITAELTENTAENSGLKASTGTKAATSRLSLRGAVRYRVVAYQTDGTYVDQAVGNAADATQVFFGDKLIAGNKYNFVIYSLGSTTTPPPAAPTTNLSTSQVALNLTSFAQNEADFMYAIENNVTILGNNTPTPLTTPLQHMFTRVALQVHTADATGTLGTASYVKGGYLSENTVQAQWTSAFASPTVSLSNGATLSAVNVASVPAVSNLNATVQTFIVNQRQNPNFSIGLTIPAGQIKVGHDVNPQPVTFSFDNASLGLKPGFSYTMRLRFNSDRFVNAAGVTRAANATDARYAVIAGYRWDRYNLGVTNTNPATNNPDANPSVKALYGNYYQWGRQASGANADTDPGIIPGWRDTEPAADGAWGTGTTKATATDPCGTGDRVPTQAEFTILGNATVHTAIGNWTTFGGGGNGPGLSDFTAAHVMTSKKSNDIKLSFPAAGHRAPTNGDLTLRQSSAIYWLKTAVGGNDRALQGRGFEDATWGTSNYYKTAGYPVRCIQDK